MQMSGPTQPQSVADHRVADGEAFGNLSLRPTILLKSPRVVEVHNDHADSAVLASLFVVVAGE